MPDINLPPIAIIADAHFHDCDSHYDWDGFTINARQLTLRSWTDTRRSSRVFNESKAALIQALSDIADRGIRHVVLLGDYSDDGQIEASERLRELLRRHSHEHGTRFFAITGNHDAYGPLGKHQSTRFVSAIGETIQVSSDPEVAASEPAAIHTYKMYCEGVPQSVGRMSEFGMFRQAEYLHWETPFGDDDSLDARRYDARSADGLNLHSLVDASYLVEPVEGLWLLMIDANVFEPRTGQWKATQKKAFLDSSDAGWNSVLRNRPHLIGWIDDVCARAARSDKTLMAFSHYPIMDPFDDAMNLFKSNEMLKRKPCETVSARLSDTGLRLHFSGHLHVNALTKRCSKNRFIEDCAVPSLAAFPACYKIVHAQTMDLQIDTVHLSSMPLDASLMDYYRAENKLLSDNNCAALATSNYGEFLYHRMHCRVEHHYLAKEWPEDIAQSVRHTTAADLAFLMSGAPAAAHNCVLNQQSENATPDQKTQLASAMSAYQITLDDLDACSMTQLVSDWYCLRHAGYIARAFIAPSRICVYSYLADTYGESATKNVTTQSAFFGVFLGMMQSALSGSEQLATREQVQLLAGPRAD